MFETLLLLDLGSLTEIAIDIISCLGVLLSAAIFDTATQDNGMFLFSEHTKNKGSSTKDKHEKGQARQKRDQERSEGLKKKK